MFGSAAPVVERSESGGSGLAGVLVFPGQPGAVWPAADAVWPAGAGRPVAELHLLGGFRLVVDGRLVGVGSSGERVLAVVACRGRVVSRAQVARVLWPDVTAERGLANLRTALYRLVRRAPGVVHVTASHVQLSLGVRVDVEAASRVAARVLAGAEVDEGLLAEAAEVDFGGDLLPGWDEEWLGAEQYRYRQLRLTALEALSVRLGAAGRHGAAVQAALAAVEGDSLRDSAHEALIRACLAQGNRNEATTHYFTYRRILRDELGLDPPTTLSRLLTSA